LEEFGDDRVEKSSVFRGLLTDESNDDTREEKGKKQPLSGGVIMAALCIFVIVCDEKNYCKSEYQFP
jgi:hypothetical protein